VFAREVNESAAIAEALNHVVLVQIDCEKGEGPEIAKKYGVSGFPTFVVVNADGEITDSSIGYPGADAWAAFAKASAEDRRTIEAKKAAYEAEPTAALARSLANRASTAYDFKGAVEYFRVARNLDPANADQYSESILTNMYYGSRGGAFTLDEVEAEVKTAFASAGATAEDKLQLASMMTGMARGAGEADRAVPYLKGAMDASEGSEEPGVAKIRAGLAVEAALLIDKDKEKALELKRATMPEGWMDSAGRLNQFAWWCFENEVNREEALELALRGVEIAETDGDRANVLDTAAELCNVLGNCDEAVEHMRHAVRIQPDKQYYKDQLARFEKALQEKKSG
jgi:tetratricopeptide (TPR) repeat protein